VWRCFLQNFISSKTASLNSGRREYDIWQYMELRYKTHSLSWKLAGSGAAARRAQALASCVSPPNYQATNGLALCIASCVYRLLIDGRCVSFFLFPRVSYDFMCCLIVMYTATDHGKHACFAQSVYFRCLALVIWEQSLLTYVASQNIAYTLHTCSFNTFNERYNTICYLFQYEFICLRTYFKISKY
jgi:hypothetical protein